jgi:hypothetical protein
VRSDNLARLKGVGWDKRKQKWYARVKIDGKNKFLGYTCCPATAHFSYLIASHIQYGEYTRAR